MKQTFELTQDWIPVTHNSISGFVLVDREAEIKENDYCISDKNIIDIGKIHNQFIIFHPQTKEHLEQLKSCWKIIATSPNLSLDNIPHIDLPKRVEEDVEKLAILFHDTYERLAPAFGYETRNDTKIFNPNSPNGKLMIAVCKEIYKANKKS